MRLPAGVPEAGSEILLETFARENGVVRQVELVDGSSVEWKMTANGLAITAPKTSESSALVFRILL